MSPHSRFWVARSDAQALLRLYGPDAARVAQLMIDSSLLAGDTDNALAVDQARRQLILMQT